ncbi:MAG: hypothetical protein Rubg2KO_15270 [Rubricoccaceae bacterium]
MPAPRFLIEPIGSPSVLSGDPVGSLLAVPTAYRVERTDANGVTVEHVVRPEHDAFVLLVALEGAVAILSPADEAELHRQIDVALGYAQDADAIADATRPRAGDREPQKHTNQQRLAWRIEEEYGYSRNGRLELASRVLGRTIDSFNSLSERECVRVWERAHALSGVERVEVAA